MRVYLDTNFFILLVEGPPTRLHDFLMSCLGKDVVLITSELTLLETLAGAHKIRDARLAALHEAILTPGDDMIVVRPIDRTVLRRTAIGRSEPGNKTPDAIHVATAMEAGCEVFVSSDRRLRVPGDMRKIPLEDLGDLI
jgi:predicted nucleic acid-binding protein